MINVKDYSVTGNGTTDDSDALQLLINGASDTLFFPTGEYLIKRPLVLPPETGHHWIGSGMAQKTSASNTGARSAIIWGGTTDATMIESHGTGFIWNGLSLWGRPYGSSGPRAAVGIHICNSCASSSGGPGDPLYEACKFWFPAILIDDCETGIKAEGNFPADSCSFGYFLARQCDFCVHLDGTQATMFNFRYVHPLVVKPNAPGGAVFKVTGGGGRIYVHSVNLVMDSDTETNATNLLEVTGSTSERGFFHINGITGDGGTEDFYLLKNIDPGDGLTHVRFTNAHFISENGNGPQHFARIDIDRAKVGGGSVGQTVVELVGCNGLTTWNGVLEGKVKIKGASSTKRSRLIVRDSNVAKLDILVDVANSSDYTASKIVA